MRFDRVIVADWSARSSPSPARESADAIWIAVADGQGVVSGYHRTRAAAEACLGGLLAQGGRQLLGLDFAMGYPAGFAALLTGLPEARAVHGWLAGAITDAADNRNNRFAVAEAVNARLGRPVFWGCPAGAATMHLPARKQVDLAALGLTERRLVEHHVPGAKTVWQLYGNGAVGSQALVGLPMVHRLALAFGAAIWPFDSVRDLTIAEVYPSLLSGPVARSGDPIRDRAQVRLLAAALFALADRGKVLPLFAVPRPAREEGWILGASSAPLLEQGLAWHAS